MRDDNPGTIHLEDYRPPAYQISRTDLHFELSEDCAVVTSTLQLQREEDQSKDSLQLQGEQLELLSVKVDGRELTGEEYRVDDDALLIHTVPVRCAIECRTRIRPQENTALSGLYRSGGLFCTQCEAEGFRRITYYLDRPDVMSVFTVTVDAEQRRYPVLLSNGNLKETFVLDESRHRAIWHDPHPKPAYLFALVAGDLAYVEDHFRTASHRDIRLRIYVEEKDLDKCGHAMESLKRAMRWDEEVYGREYDLDIFNIVAVDDFNMGAMENKGLNIFNASCVLCNPEVTTDAGFQRVESIVAHEYFHNWSGNRVTCRDWFQLSLKEGFTVFRDGQFSSDMGSPTVKRIEDANLLRTAQFAEDAGPMAHPVRPESCIEINNFYTLTVYEKGAEVVRMIHTLLGAESFRRGSDLYFERHDGQAVTCEDFVRAMEDASGVDLTQFRNWYSQAGTPELDINDEYDASARRYTLTVEQSCPPTPGQSEKPPFVIPLAMGLLGREGNLALPSSERIRQTEIGNKTHAVLTVDRLRQSFIFEGIPDRPVPSLLRGFSAPVRLRYHYSRDDLCALMRGDSDGFVRWDAAQSLAIEVLTEMGQQVVSGESVDIDARLTSAWVDLLNDDSLDAAMVAEMLRLPSEEYLAELASRRGGADVDLIHQVRDALCLQLGRSVQGDLLSRYGDLAIDRPYKPDAQQIARRSLRNTCLSYLVSSDAAFLDLATEQYRAASNMTDRISALRAIAFHGEDDLRDGILENFYQNWRHEVLVVNQWLQVQAAIPDDQALSRVEALMSHAEFDLHNPNNVRALVGTFANQNPVNFHRSDGAGYRLLGSVVTELNRINPQIASRLLLPLTRWRNYRGRKDMMRAELERLAAQPDLSPDVFEIVSKSLRESAPARMN
ncbi:MAG: aminopeptidase N [Halioglobus sp.]|nr:aminopeptidase N [Halioglobus sp.]